MTHAAVARSFTRPVARLVAPGKGPSQVRIQLIGSGGPNWDIRLPLSLGGASMRTNGGMFHGVNWGAYGAHGGLDRLHGTSFPSTIAAAVAEAVADGVQQIRAPGYGRWRGQYNNSPGADSEDDNCYASTSATNILNELNVATAVTNARIWLTIVDESDCGQSGMIDSGTAAFCGAFAGAGEVPMIMDDNGNWTVDTVHTTFTTAGGYNYFTSPKMFNRLLQRWLLRVSMLCHLPYILAWELISEPLSSSGLYTYDSSWSPRIKSCLRVLIREIRRIDPFTPFVIGGRNAYNLIPELTEMVLTERGDCLYTWDALNGGSAPPNHIKHPGRVQSFLNLMLPGYQNQFGTKSSDDPSDWGFNAGYAVYKAYGIPCTCWQHRDATLNNTDSSGYGWRFTTDVGVTWTDKPARIAFGRARLADTVTSIVAAATSAINAATNPVAFPLLPLAAGSAPNVFTDAGVTHATAAGQAIEQINPWLGSSIANLIQPTSANRPTILASAVADYLTASGDRGLVDGYLAAKFDGVNFFLQGASQLFTAGTEDMTVIVAGVAATVAAVQDFLFVGNNANATAYPQISLDTNGKARVRFTNTAGTNFDCNGTTVLWDVPCVITITKVGNVKKMFVNGIQEGATESSAVGATATTRLRVGGKPSGVATFKGAIGWVFACENGMSDANRIATERLGGLIVGAPYQL